MTDIEGPPVQQQPEVVYQDPTDDDGYTTYLLDIPFTGWVSSDSAYIHIEGHRQVTLSGEGPLSFDVEPPVVQQLPSDG